MCFELAEDLSFAFRPHSPDSALRVVTVTTIADPSCSFPRGCVCDTFIFTIAPTPIRFISAVLCRFDLLHALPRFLDESRTVRLSNQRKINVGVPVTSAAVPGHILFAGGCHVNGYPVGEASSFSQLTADALSCTATRIAPISLGNPSRLFDYLERHRPPEIMVLQFGNYEVPRPIAKHARAVFSSAISLRGTRSSSSSSKRPWLSLPPHHVFEPTPGWHLRGVLKRAYASAAQHANPPLYDPNAVRERLRWLLSHLAPFQIPTTVVLSPLPCADHMARGFRITAAPIFQEQAARASVLSLDTSAALGYSDRRSKHSFAIYADERHLNLRGHQMLANSLVQLLRSNRPEPSVGLESEPEHQTVSV